ncbi:MAG: XRE family transcriptional regulator [Candidatus Omnitrophota bacterium]
MPLTLALIGKRLRLARENARITQENAAERIGVPRTAIVQIEAGNRSTSTLELSELANLYDRPITDFLAEDNPIGAEDDILVALYRMAPGVEADERMKNQVTRCIHICREGTDLEILLNRQARTGPPAYKELAPRNVGEAIEQGNRIAEQERKRLDLGYSPIPDMAGLICSQGIWASGTSLPNGVSGLFLNHPSLGMSILVNIDEPRNRKRFSYAHEYAHALLDRSESIKVTKTDNRNELAEVRANAFAAAFLLPENGVTAFIASVGKGNPTRDMVPVYDLALEKSNAPLIQVPRRAPSGSQIITCQDAAEVANHFGVSYQAATYRLKSLRFINQAECKDLLEQENIGKLYLGAWKKESEDNTCDRCLDQEIAYLALEALRLGEISQGRFNDIVDLLDIPDIESFRQFAESIH